MEVCCRQLRCVNEMTARMNTSPKKILRRCAGHKTTSAFGKEVK
jgi:hypothetical protein